MLAALQREARFVDIVKEPLGEYSDEQIVRRHVMYCETAAGSWTGCLPSNLWADEEEGAELEAPADYDANRYRLTGTVAGDPPYRGRLVHHGWQATQCELPRWSGSESAARVVRAH